MTAVPGIAELPPDPSFTPETYVRTALILRSGVIGFLVLSGVGMVIGLVESPGMTVSSLIGSSPFVNVGDPGTFLSSLASFQANALILLGVFVMVAVSVGRVVDAMGVFIRGRETILAVVCGVVVALLVFGLTVVASIVH